MRFWPYEPDGRNHHGVDDDNKRWPLLGIVYASSESGFMKNRDPRLDDSKVRVDNVL